jgi:hypothetical protein
MSLDIRLTKSHLADRIRRRLGHPVVKVELDQQQIYDSIDYSRDKFIKWAVGNAVTETFFTVMLSAGQVFYDLPIGVTEIVDYYDKGSSYGINQLFTIDNFLYSQGMFNPILWPGNVGYSFVSYHVALDFLSMVKRYSPTKYNYKYHRYTNQLEVQPAPPSGSALLMKDSLGNEITVDSPGFLLIDSYMIEGSQYGGMETNQNIATWKRGDSDENFFTSDWIFDYSLAECKIILGTIRRKFQNFNSIGNVGISLDGDTLVQEGKEEKEKLNETLRLEENFEGYPIIIGY